MKREFDLLFSIVLLALVFPIFIVFIPVLRFTGEGCIFFVQKRFGKGGRRFSLLKFATMLRNSPNSGTVTTMNDPRILPMGRFLRATKINELPQILNVAKGDMSIVGPRPLTEEVFQYYPEGIRAVICRMKPGLTGMGTIVFRNEERFIFESGKEKMVFYAQDVIPLKGALEKWYFEHQSLWVDLKIIVATAAAIILPESRFYLRWFDIEPLLKASSLRVYFGADQKRPLIQNGEERTSE